MASSEDELSEGNSEAKREPAQGLLNKWERAGAGFAGLAALAFAAYATYDLDLEGPVTVLAVVGGLLVTRERPPGPRSYLER